MIHRKPRGLLTSLVVSALIHPKCLDVISEEVPVETKILVPYPPEAQDKLDQIWKDPPKMVPVRRNGRTVWQPEKRRHKF